LQILNGIKYAIKYAIERFDFYLLEKFSLISFKNNDSLYNEILNTKADSLNVLFVYLQYAEFSI